MNTLDIIVLLLITASGLFAFVRGFVREVLSIGAWIAAALVTSYGFEPTAWRVRELIHPPWIADLVDVTSLFVLSLLAFSLIVGLVSRGVRASGLSAVDRALGLLFGLGRAGVLLCLSYLMLSHLFPPATWPEWAADARSLPLMAAGGEALKEFIPHQMLDQGTRAFDTAGNSITHNASPAEFASQAARALNATADALAGGGSSGGQQPSNTASPNLPTGYSADQIRDLNRALEQTQRGGKN